MTLLKAFGAVAALCLFGTVGFGAAAWRSSIDPITPPETGSFDGALVKRGAELAAIGNCNVCHTAAGGRVYAGGAGLPTPFGTIYSTNITPDAETGIGRWSEAAFRRAMRKVWIGRVGTFIPHSLTIISRSSATTMTRRCMPF